jgi:hypothetical protein
MALNEKAYLNALLLSGVDKGKFPSKLYKYRDINNRTIQIIKKQEFYFATPLSFNDPFDCNLEYQKDYTEKEIDQEFRSFAKRRPYINYEDLKIRVGFNSKNFYDFYLEGNRKMIKDSGILSLSKSSTNITMWSHYANNHNGIVFELDIKKDLDFFTLFGTVEYKDTYEILSFCKDNREELLKLFLTKYTDWEYEKEVRIIDLEKNGNRRFKKEVIKTIIFGCKTNRKYIKAIIKLCNKNNLNHIKFKKAKLIPGKFALDFDDINKDDYLDN